MLKSIFRHFGEFEQCQNISIQLSQLSQISVLFWLWIQIQNTVSFQQVFSKYRCRLGKTVFLYLYPPILDQRRMLRKKLRSEITEIGHTGQSQFLCTSRV